MTNTDRILESIRAKVFFSRWSAVCQDDWEILQTHASVVIRTKQWVFKIKKEVNFGFLDFSSLEKRLSACQAEITLNSRFSPDVYLAVLPIVVESTQDRKGHPQLLPPPDSSQIGLPPITDETILEYAVWMLRLDDAHSWKSQILAESSAPGLPCHSLDRKEHNLSNLAVSLNNFYEKHRLTVPVPYFDNLTSAILGNFPTNNADPILGLIKAQTLAILHSLRATIQARVDGGTLSDCHGDLHLEHIYWQENGKPLLIDCIEFNNSFRWIDPWADVAFLLMDLDYNNQRDTSRKLEALLDILGKVDPNLILLYKLYRAMVRSKVNRLKSIESEVSQEEQRSAREASESYKALSLRYIFQSKDLLPTVVCMMGKIGSGKSTLAQDLSSLTGWQILSSDWIRKESAGISPMGLSPPEKRETLYTAENTQRTYATLYRKAVEIGSGGNCAILDATFARRELRRDASHKLSRIYPRIVFCETRADPATTQRRLEARNYDPHCVSDARWEDYLNLESKFEPWEDSESKSTNDAQTEVVHLVFPHFPTQNTENILPKISSVPTTPLI